MKLAALSPETIEKIKPIQYDKIVGKHEGAWNWAGVLRYYEPEFMDIEGYPVLLPLEAASHANITILRLVVSRDERVLTIFLKDTTYVDDPEFEVFEAGFLAICEQVPEEDFYVATVYHEWFILDPLEEE